LKPDFTKYFTSETKYSIAITADDSVTKKFPVLKDGPLEVALFCALSLMSLHISRTLTLPTSLPMFYSSSVEMPRTSGLMPAMTLCPTMKILPKLTSVQCGLPSLSTTEHPTRPLKDYKIFYERPRNPPI
jgi:hypothetical protein